MPPESTVESFESFDPAREASRDLVIRSLDKTADNVHVFLNVPAGVTDEELLEMAGRGEGRAAEIDRDLFAFGFFDVPHGNNVASVVTFERTGNASVRRVPGLFVETEVGAGLGDLDFDGSLSPTDLVNVEGAFEDVLYSRGVKFNPAADLDGDGLVDNRDLFLLNDVLTVGGADATTLAAFSAMLLRRGDVDQDGTTSAADVDALRAAADSDAWLVDLNVDGTTDEADVIVLLETILNTRAGDLNLDGAVNIADLTAMAANWMSPSKIGYAGGDLTGDGRVDEFDLTVMAENWKAGAGGAAASPLSMPTSC